MVGNFDTNGVDLVRLFSFAMGRRIHWQQLSNSKIQDYLQSSCSSSRFVGSTEPVQKGIVQRQEKGTGYFGGEIRCRG